MKILVINSGSSSLKYQLFDMNGEKVLAKGQCERIGQDLGNFKYTRNGDKTYESQKPIPDHNAAIKLTLEALADPKIGVISSLKDITAIGHRILHGGEKLRETVLVTPEVKKVIDEMKSLGPLHNPPGLAGIEACERAMPTAPQVAVFDTAFHSSLPDYAYIYAIPYEYYKKYGIRRYGFHGTSHRFVAHHAAEILKTPLMALKLITLHLGNGASVCAVDGGQSVDTSMGLTPLEGLVMGTRSGSIDPAIVKFLAQSENVTVDEIDNILNKKSGILGISGVGSDFRDVEKALHGGDKRAKLAIDAFCYSVKKYIGAYIAAMNGCDALVFTAGVGENDSFVRGLILQNLEFLGIKVDDQKNKSAIGVDAIISEPESRIKVLVVPTNEELMIARDAANLLKKSAI
jgi:acetate kinase